MPEKQINIDQKFLEGWRGIKFDQNKKKMFIDRSIDPMDSASKAVSHWIENQSKKTKNKKIIFIKH
jgi:hypothetical protein